MLCFLTLFGPRTDIFVLNLEHSFIKDSEILVKTTGDYGGGSFKLLYQIANVFYPNSFDNTALFSIFEAKDYRSNVKIGSNIFPE